MADKTRYYVEADGDLVANSTHQPAIVMLSSSEDLLNLNISSKLEPGTLAHVCGSKAVFELGIDRTWGIKDNGTDRIKVALENVVAYCGTVDTVEELNALETEGLKLGSMYDVLELGHNYVWNGTSWDDVGGFAIVGEDLQDILDSKVDRNNAVVDSTFSRGRVPGSEVGDGSFAFGENVIASGRYSSAEGKQTNAAFRSQHVFGENNIIDSGSNNATNLDRGTYVEIVGNGTDTSNRSNARTLDWEGNETLAGGLTCNNRITIGNTTITEVIFQDLIDLVNVPSAIGQSF